MDLQNLPDETLATQAAGGNTSAADLLLTRYKNLVRATARPYFIIGADSEDLVQEGMIGLYKAISQFHTEKAAGFAAFASVCIKNQILTAVRNASRKKHSPLNTYVSIDRENPEILHIIDQGADANPESALMQQESRRNLHALVSTSLSALESAVLAHFLAGLSYTEIAQIQGISAKSVDNALFRIRRKVAKLLET